MYLGIFAEITPVFKTWITNPIISNYTTVKQVLIVTMSHQKSLANTNG